MKPNRISKLYRIFAALAVLAVLVAAAPYPAQAAALPTFSILSITPDESVRIRTYNFPANQLFTVRMDVVGNAAVNGIIVTTTNSGAGGSFDETYRIPAELKGKAQIAIRFESAGGYYAYNWFNNKTSAIPTAVPSTGTSTTFSPRGPYIRIVGVDSDHTVTLDAYNLPLNTDFKVRIGPFYNFWRGHEVVGTINTGSTSNFRFTLHLPDVVKGVTWVSVRIDSSNGYFAYNAFKNVDQSISTSVPDSNGGVIYSGDSCSITSYAPASSITHGSEFDAKWTVKNTGDTDWNKDQIDYAFRYGTEMQKRADRYDLPKTVKPGESITIIVDMVAPTYTGYYSTTWGLMKNSSVVCNLPLTVYIK